MRALAIAALALAGCSSGNLRSCTIEEHGEQDVCLEYQRASQDAIEREARPECARRAGHWADAPCARANVIAGCMQRVITQKYGVYSLVTWYYVAASGLRTAPDVASSCRAQGGVALAP
jgi:hypothetical protein